ncbi:hypothetical protein ASZ78_005136 [Callipepla squamata]|uniref:Profilin-4 n=1 Tax=Callipepla squamata TaxID=9009 RepID=A0A226MJY2_CALSU|nr:hypothetical protein ASZ78_005136 [Callipepla squamata]
MDQLQALLNGSLIRTKHVENAAAISVGERETVASTSGFHVGEGARAVRTQVPPENAINLIYAFYKNLLRVRKEGLYFKQKHYRCVRADEHSIYLRNADGGLVAVKTNSLILIATYRAGMHPSVCVEAVEKLGKTTTWTFSSAALANSFKNSSDKLPNPENLWN